MDPRESAIREVRERLRRPPYWGPNEQGDFMVDMTVESYERDLDQLVRAALGECEPERPRRMRTLRQVRLAHYPDLTGDAS